MTEREQNLTDRRRELEQLLKLRDELSEQYPDEWARIVVVDEFIWDCLTEIKKLEGKDYD